MPTLNRPLVERIIAQLAQRPETHSQTAFGYRGGKCGTSHCVAGWAAALTPDTELVWSDLMLQEVVMPDQRTLSPEIAGAELLGLDPEEAYARDIGAKEPPLFYDFGDTEHMLSRLRDLLATETPDAAS